MKVLRKQLAFKNEDSEANNIEFVELRFDDSAIEDIKKVMQICSDNKCISSINMWFSKFEYLNEDGEDYWEWMSDYHKLVIYDDTFYFYAKNKYDADDVIESEEIKLSELF